MLLISTLILVALAALVFAVLATLEALKHLREQTMMLAVLVKLQQQRNDVLGAWKNKQGREMLRSRLTERLRKEEERGATGSDTPTTPSRS